MEKKRLCYSSVCSLENFKMKFAVKTAVPESPPANTVGAEDVSYTRHAPVRFGRKYRYVRFFRP